MRCLLSALLGFALLVALPAHAFIYYSEQNMPLNGQDKNGQPVGMAVELLRLIGASWANLFSRSILCPGHGAGIC